jgi:hypothetical protein
MVLALIRQPENCLSLLQSASDLARMLQKPFGVVICAGKSSDILHKETVLPPGIKPALSRMAETDESIQHIADDADASFLFIQPASMKHRIVRNILDECRDLRIPYLIFPDTFPILIPDKVLVPVNFLIEEIEKAQFAAAFGRFCNSEICLLTARDYGSKAQVNTQKISTVLDKFGLQYQQQTGKKDSFKIEYDAITKAAEENYNLIIASASREYGLDDIFFGPKELHLICKSSVPVMLINPRGDLYTLCD